MNYVNYELYNLLVSANFVYMSICEWLSRVLLKI